MFSVAQKMIHKCDRLRDVWPLSTEVPLVWLGRPWSHWAPVPTTTSPPPWHAAAAILFISSVSVYVISREKVLGFVSKLNTPSGLLSVPFFRGRRGRFLKVGAPPPSGSPGPCSGFTLSPGLQVPASQDGRQLHLSLVTRKRQNTFTPASLRWRSATTVKRRLAVTSLESFVFPAWPPLKTYRFHVLSPLHISGQRLFKTVFKGFFN